MQTGNKVQLFPPCSTFNDRIPSSLVWAPGNFNLRTVVPCQKFLQIALTAQIIPMRIGESMSIICACCFHVKVNHHILPKFCRLKRRNTQNHHAKHSHPQSKYGTAVRFRFRHSEARPPLARLAAAACPDKGIHSDMMWYEGIKFIKGFLLLSFRQSVDLKFFALPTSLRW